MTAGSRRLRGLRYALDDREELALPLPRGSSAGQALGVGHTEELEHRRKRSRRASSSSSMRPAIFPGCLITVSR